jgi:hypothetical protein
VSTGEEREQCASIVVLHTQSGHDKCTVSAGWSLPCFVTSECGAFFFFFVRVSRGDHLVDCMTPLLPRFFSPFGAPSAGGLRYSRLGATGKSRVTSKFGDGARDSRPGLFIHFNVCLETMVWTC